MIVKTYAERFYCSPGVTDIEMTKRRLRKIKSLLEELGHPVFEIKSPHKSLINSLVCSIYLLDISTIYLVALRKIDPSPTPAIDILKEAG